MNYLKYAQRIKQLHYHEIYNILCIILYSKLWYDVLLTQLPFWPETKIKQLGGST